MTSKKILVLAYAISPTRGSEYSVAWNYVINMSKDNELVILYGMSGDHMGDVDEMDHFIKETTLPKVRFIYIKPNKLANALNSLNKKGILVYSFYLAYNIWHKQVYTKAKKLISLEDFDVIHYLGPIGYREPGYLWKLKLPYIWGPIGGTTNISMKLIKALPLSGKIKLGFRAIVNNIQLHFNPRLKKAIYRSDILMTATSQNKINIKKVFNTSSYYIPENGIMGDIHSPNENKFFENTIKLVWIGSIDERKALIILLESFKKLSNPKAFQLHIIGDGPLKHQLQDFINTNQLSEYIIWHGILPRSKVINLLANSHFNIITSVSEGNPTTIWEAMSVGVPTISLDHCGMHDTICENCGIKINIISYNQVINDLAIQLDHLSQNPHEIKILSNGVIECAKKYTWEHRRTFFNNIYEAATENWDKKNSCKL